MDSVAPKRLPGGARSSSPSEVPAWVAQILDTRFAAPAVTQVAEVCELIPFDSQPGHLFRVNARHLHQKLEVGRDFSNWIRDRIEKFQLIKDKDYIIIAKSGENSGRGRPAVEYMLTTHTARILSADVGTPVGREVIRYLVARDEQLTEQETRVRIPTTMSVILQLEAP